MQPRPYLHNRNYRQTIPRIGASLRSKQPRSLTVFLLLFLYESLQKASSLESVPGADENEKKAAVQLRRLLVLGLVGGTSKSNPSLDRILESTEYLTVLTSWLDDVLTGTIGDVDFLLDFLKNVAGLPVTSAMVKQSGLGKLIGSIEKNEICSGPKENSIRENVELVKMSWKASVKARKNATTASSKPPAAPKREVPAATSASSSPPTAKRIKVADSSPKSSLSSLLQRVSAGSGKGSDKAMSAWNASNSASSANGAKKKKAGARVKWADHFGGELKDSRLIEGENIVPESNASSSESWSDRKKRDREKEKKLLLTMKKAKLLDDDDEEDAIVPVQPAMQATVAWKVPALLPETPDVPKPQLNSTEVQSQNDRMKTVVKAHYSSENSVPPSPTPLSDIEQALDMTAQASASVASIPFFAKLTTDTAAISASVIPQPGFVDYSAPPPVAATPGGGATPEFVQALGLPLYLVGQSTQALQTLAASPGLLNSLVDASGMYDQTRLLSLVQTLSGVPASAPAPVAAAPPYAPPAPALSSYGSSGGYSAYGGGKSYTMPRARNDEGNLHVSGYGPMTTQADLIALFSPYVVVDEVVMKGTFAFVNTSDPVNAQRAREALTGTLLGGQPLRINSATRKNRDSSTPRAAASGFNASTYGHAAAPSPGAFSFSQGGGFQNQLPPAQPASIDDVRDSRGNAPTKNLFVAGYGPGTSEIQVRQLFAQHCHVVGVVLKGNFTFVNTNSREDAVKAREMLQDNIVNGGPLRINFAKETGRLGTSFDLTYNQSSGPNARRPPFPPQPPSVSHYGR